MRRTPSELVAAEVLRQSAAQFADMQSLLELEYQHDVKSYMFDMEVSTVASFPCCDASFGDGPSGGTGNSKACR